MILFSSLAGNHNLVAESNFTPYTIWESGGCLEGCLVDVWAVSEQCLVGMSGRGVRDVWECLGGVWGVSGGSGRGLGVVRH